MLCLPTNVLPALTLRLEPFTRPQTHNAFDDSAALVFIRDSAARRQTLLERHSKPLGHFTKHRERRCLERQDFWARSNAQDKMDSEVPTQDATPAVTHTKAQKLIAA